jgi:methionyl-tRNA formyltransferase
VRAVVLTRNPQGLASRFVARPAPAGVEIVAVLLDEGRSADRVGRLRARVRKVLRVGPTAVPVGLALRRPYDAAGGAVAPIESLGVPVRRVPTLNGTRARAVLRELGPELAISLDNSLLEEETFAMPRLGTVNVHHGAVPDFRGGPPVFWELAAGRDRVGYTIHRIDRGVDTGPVLAAGEVPIERRPTLAETLAATIPRLHDASLGALEDVLAALARGDAREQPQPPSTAPARTTPSLRDYVRVRRELRRR